MYVGYVSIVAKRGEAWLKEYRPRTFGQRDAVLHPKPHSKPFKLVRVLMVGQSLGNGRFSINRSNRSTQPCMSPSPLLYIIRWFRALTACIRESPNEKLTASAGPFPKMMWLGKIPLLTLWLCFVRPVQLQLQL